MQSPCPVPIDQRPTRGIGRFLDIVFGAPEPLRSEDLLPADQPLRPFPERHRWRFNPLVRIAGFCLILAGLGIIVALIMLAISGWMNLPDPSLTNPFPSDLPPYWVTPVLSMVLIVASYWLTGRLIERRPCLHELTIDRALQRVCRGLVLGAVLMGISAGFLAVIKVFHIDGLNPGYSPWMDLIRMGLVAGVTEEVLFRGLLFRLVEGTFGTWAAVAISALVFGGVHLSNPHGTWAGTLGIALEAGVLFAAVYAFTRSLWMVIGLHFAWNVVQGPVMGIVVSGSSSAGHGLTQSDLTGPPWLSGGDFGIEASAPTVIILTTVGALVLISIARRDLIVRPFWVRRKELASHHRADLTTQS